MYETQHDDMIQRGIDEALACQDMLTRSPATPSRLERLRQRLEAAVRAVLRGRSAPRLVRPAAPLESRG